MPPPARAAPGLLLLLVSVGLWLGGVLVVGGVVRLAWLVWRWVG